MDSTVKKEKKPAVSAIIICLTTANPQIELWHCGQECYATICGHHMALSSSTFKRWISTTLFGLHKTAVSPAQLTSAMPMIEAAALERKEHKTYQRVARVGDTIYLDLGRAYVEITGSGWKVVDDVPVKFLRDANFGVLPEPVPGVADALRDVIATDDDNWILIKGWLLDALKGRGPFQVLVVNGPEGSAKTSLCRTLKMTLDPVISCPLLGLPRDEEGFGSFCGHDYILAFDNVSRLALWQSDVICRIATGAGFRKRKLYTDDEQFQVQATRPQILNGIPEFAEFADLQSRSVILTQPPVANYRTEAVLGEEFRAILPGVLGGLCEMVAAGLRANQEAVRADRMADTAAWITACGLSEWSEVYQTAKEAGDDIVLDASPVANLVVKFVNTPSLGGGNIKASAGDLLEKLKVFALETNLDLDRTFPATPKGLSDRLLRDATLLRRRGVLVSRIKSNGNRFLVLTRDADRDARDAGEQNRDAEGRSEPSL